MRSPASHNTTVSNAQSSSSRSVSLRLCSHPLDITRQIPRYGHIGRVKFTNDDAKLSKNRRIRLRNPSVPPGWVGIMGVRLQSLQNPTTPCRNHSHILLQDNCCTVYLNSHCHTQPGGSHGTTRLSGQGI